VIAARAPEVAGTVIPVSAEGRLIALQEVVGIVLGPQHARRLLEAMLEIAAGLCLASD
jgi:hypothetical protein